MVKSHNLNFSHGRPVQHQLPRPIPRCAGLDGIFALITQTLVSLPSRRQLCCSKRPSRRSSDVKVEAEVAASCCAHSSVRLGWAAIRRRQSVSQSPHLWLFLSSLYPDQRDDVNAAVCTAARTKRNRTDERTNQRKDPQALLRIILRSPNDRFQSRPLAPLVC